eukprot:TRINITY_DN7327_c0_g1_i1.p1 TRINITY_DN7327_c0_g1~~TRINITY_DN7327_c0_g1_i1.p1  ORF type:complete len:248 (+),score=36.39 TRINITY_DN7327_c0_g1_i1:72-746(+)
MDSSIIDISNITLIPCSNFSMLVPGVYRSGYPSKKNFAFLRRLGIRSICYLCPEEYAMVNQEFYRTIGIQILKFPMEGNKEPFVNIPEEQVNRALSTICDTRNHPILIHCNKGKHRTGAVCGCLRKVQGWSLVSIIDEYNRFAGDKGRAVDQQFVELFRPFLTLRSFALPSWLSIKDISPLFVNEIMTTDDSGSEVPVATTGRMRCLADMDDEPPKQEPVAPAG